MRGGWLPPLSGANAVSPHVFFFRQNNSYSYRAMHRPHQSFSWHVGNGSVPAIPSFSKSRIRELRCLTPITDYHKSASCLAYASTQIQAILQRIPRGVHFYVAHPDKTV